MNIGEILGLNLLWPPTLKEAEALNCWFWHEEAFANGLVKLLIKGQIERKKKTEKYYEKGKKEKDEMYKKKKKTRYMKKPIRLETTFWVWRLLTRPSILIAVTTIIPIYRYQYCKSVPPAESELPRYEVIGSFNATIISKFKRYV